MQAQALEERESSEVIPDENEKTAVASEVEAAHNQAQAESPSAEGEGGGGDSVTSPSSGSRQAGRKVSKFRQREALMSRANSLKKAVRQIIEHAEKTLDEQNSSHNHKIVVVRPMSLTVQQQQLQQFSSVVVGGGKASNLHDLIMSPDTETGSTRSDNIKPVAQLEEVGVVVAGVIGPSPSTSAVGLVAPINQCASSTSPVGIIDPNVTLPVPMLFDQARKLSNASTNASTISAEDFEDEVADLALDKIDIPLIDGSDNGDEQDPTDTKESRRTGEVEEEGEEVANTGSNVKEDEGEQKSGDGFPKIEVESPSSSARTPKDSDDSVIEADNDTSIGQDSSYASNKNDDSGASAASPNPVGANDGGAGGLLAVPGSKAFPRGASPRGSRRISMGSLLKPLEVEIPTSPKSSKGDPSDVSYSSAANSPFSSSAHSSPNKSSSHQHHVKRKTLPIVNPLVTHPAWPAVASGGVVSKVLLANADTICAVASPLMDPEIDPDDLMLGFEEKCVMNNYFGIGIDAKITLDFHLKREEHPEKLRSRTRNFLWYGVLGGKEFLQKSCKNLEQRVQLECDGKRVPLPSLQGIVILNIQRYVCSNC